MSFIHKLFRRGESKDAQTNEVLTEEPAPARTPETEPVVKKTKVTSDPLKTRPVPVVSAPPEEGSGDDTEDGTHKLEKGAMPTLTLSLTHGMAAWAGRDIGRVRQMNQDHVLALIQNLPRGSSDVAMGLFVVADGMGGHTGGEIASRVAVETILVSVLEQLVLPAMAEEDPGTALQTLMITAVQDSNTRILQMGQQQGTDMGTTCTAVLFLGNGLYIAHVGDSRAYVLAGGELRQITTDHSAVGRLIQLGQLTPEQAQSHPLRNQLYRSIGQNAEVQVDFLYYPIDSASHLLLCSDGLWGMVPDPEIAAILEEAPSPEAASKRLIARANMLGGEDNISAVVVSLPHEGSPL